MLVQVRVPRENLGIAGYAPDMRAGVGVIRLDGVQQRLERRGTKSLGAPPRAPLVNRQSAGGDTDSERPEFWHAAELSKKRTAGGYIRGMPQAARVSARGARRWNEGHPWIYRSDVVARPEIPAGAVLVEDQRRGYALGFLTREFTVDRGNGPEALVAVYLPTNNLYLGDVVICERDRTVFPDITVEEGIRILLTGGMALPPRLRL